MSKKDLLDEYHSIKSELDKLNTTVELIRQDTKTKLENAKYDHEKDKIFTEFRNNIDNIKNDKELKKKYKQLKIRQNEILILLDSSDKPVNISSSIESNKSNPKLLESNSKDNRAIDVNNSQLSNNIKKLISKYKRATNEQLIVHTPPTNNNIQKHVSIMPKKYDDKMDKLFKYLKL
jgi:hypothetical protein